MNNIRIQLPPQLIILWLLLSVFISGCGGTTKYHVGIVTNKIYGTIQFADANESGNKPFIIVQESKATFIEGSQGRYHRETARIVFPNKKGEYQLFLASGTSQITLSFFCQGYINSGVQFTRTLGIGRIEHPVVLKKDLNWKGNFILHHKPFLSGFIVDLSYNMPPKDQLFLGDLIRKLE